ncbi:prepilin-type N-terminal cleavage/methylation domain-containing protein [Pseudoalteromonas luteoviolacea]|uniref:type IV pilus modification PilV family protein n=1 Tax=Pseudoalteromonas luteoviolacea TaxID=43657 RepID=UPI001F33D1CB|nr:prepilin-type N-terminal cleavage/methylation domain-containing protein [Pseudoalteromonas luteoviolacea]MCF6438484.1 prepilin-type N-terminal cleavage/methylation domain-containing protein [Pseudoalteromonas luteoviolacea]
MRLEKGFSLIEVMVSIVIAGVALLGLAGAQLKSLQFANNSFNYTLALVHGQNAIERMWTDLCHFQHVDQDLVTMSKAEVSRLHPIDTRFKLNISPDRYNDPALIRNSPDQRDVTFTVSWDDSRVQNDNQNNLLNQITLVASYVYVPAPTPASPCN